MQSAASKRRSWKNKEQGVMNFRMYIMKKDFARNVVTTQSVQNNQNVKIKGLP